jgi:hypothetical protein
MLVCFRVVSRVPQNGFAPRKAGFTGWLPTRRRRGSAETCRQSGANPARDAKTMKNMTRRGLLGAASVARATTFLGKPARAAVEFEFKLGINTPDTHPDRPPHRGRACDRGTVGRATQCHGFPQQPVRRRSRDAVAASCRRHRAIGGALDVAIDAGTGPSQCRLRLPVPMTGPGPPWTAGSAISSATPSEGPASCRCGRSGTTASARSPHRPAGN